MVSQTERAFNVDAEGRRRRQDRPKPEQKSVHPLETVPFFQRPMDASTDDKPTGNTDEAGNIEYKTILGNRYFVKLNPDQRTTRTKIEEDVLPAVKKYLADPTAPTADQVIASAKAIAGDAWETLSIPGDLLSGEKGASDVTLGQVFELTGGTAAASTMFDVPGGRDTLRIFGGPGAKSYYNRDYNRAKELEARGYSAAQIEAETGRVKTSTPDDYLDNKPKTLADISPEYKNLVAIRDQIKGLIKQISTKNSPSAASEIVAPYKRELAEINQKIAKFERANPADEAGIVVKPRNPFKFEIDDSDIKIKSSDGNQTLSEATRHSPIIVRNIIPDHKELFKEYPNLEYVEFYVDDAATNAHFNPTRSRHGAIVVNPKLKEKLVDPNNESFRNTFFHELQHAAQFQDERIAFLEQLGGSPTYFGEIIAKYPNSKQYESLINRNEKLVQLKDEIVAIFEKHKSTGALDQRSTGARLPNQVPDPSEIFGDVKVAKQIARKMRELDAELFKTYISTASEVEAIIAGNRARKLGKSPTSRVVSDLSNQRNIETREEYWEGKPKSPLGKKKAQVKLKLGSMTDEEIIRYAKGGINFASYATGIDKELFSFDASGPLKGNYAEGGKVGNMSMKQQMSLFEYGGIADDGMTKDPVSGNNIPPGSLAKEVRDDIPAMLSEGEYVVPADVLRYYGVNFFEKLRNQAKTGLQNMEQNGRIGGTPMTQQDVARNMQQPQAAPQAMPKPILAADGTLVMGYDEGGPQLDASQYRSSWSPAKARYYSPMFQGTSSQKANIAAAEASPPAEGEEITQFRNHYNQAGDSVQVRYIGTSPENMRIAEGQEDLIAEYPLTEEEWLAYKKEMSRSDNDDPDPTPTGSDTSWMDGIDWSDQQSVKDWVESDDGLGMSAFARGIAEKGGIIGAIPQGIQANDIAKVRGVRDYYAKIGDKEMVDYLDGKIDEAMENPGLLTSALDKLGLMTGKNYFNQMMDLDYTTQQNIKLGGMSLEENQAMTAKAIQEKEDRQKTAAEIHAEAMASAQSGSTADIVEKSGEEGSANREQTEQNLSDVLSGLETGAKTGTIQLDKGGLMAAPKPKKKRGRPKKSGLAGKK